MASSSSSTGDLKRKRSPSHEVLPQPAPPAKSAKANNHLQINYLARQYSDDLPLVSNDDTLPSILALLTEYQGVLERHESMAGNLGARPLGPILIKRFERLFDGPPKVLKSHGKDGATVTWLDVVEFARNKPEQFTLGQMSEGLRVCQFYTKQCRVQISEEDFVLISSGIPQKMIPPQPIAEDEEKELVTLEILEKNLGQICQLADQVAARTRQLNHRLKGRKQAILDRRATEPSVSVRATSPSNVALMNGASQAGTAALASVSQPGQSSAPGFVAVNARPQSDVNGTGDPGTASRSTHHDLLSKFFTLSERRGNGSNTVPSSELRRPTSSTAPGNPTMNTASTPSTKATRSTVNTAAGNPSAYSDADYATLLLNSASPVPIPGTPASLLPPHASRTTPAEKDDGGPFKAEMVARMEGLNKGERVIPPCDRCRRLHMDCLKNLTACMGCTKKHAKCSWKEVREIELLQTADQSGRDESGGRVRSDDGEGGADENERVAAGEGDAEMHALEMAIAAERATASGEAMNRGLGSASGTSVSTEVGFADQGTTDKEAQQHQHQSQQQIPTLLKSVYSANSTSEKNGDAAHLHQPQHRLPAAAAAAAAAISSAAASASTSPLAMLPSFREITSSAGAPPARTNGHGLPYGRETGATEERDRDARHGGRNENDGHGEAMVPTNPLSAPEISSIAALRS